VSAHHKSKADTPLGIFPAETSLMAVFASPIILSTLWQQSFRGMYLVT
jgi:hypothetical protein